jgi:hypothetical protein
MRVHVVSKLIFGADIRMQMVRAIADVNVGPFALVVPRSAIRKRRSGRVSLRLREHPGFDGDFENAAHTQPDSCAEGGPPG